MLGLFQTKPNLIVHSTQPLNAEPPLDRLRRAFVTPIDDFYIRTHGDIPQIDPATHRLTVEGRVRTPLILSLDDLKKNFEPRTVMAVMQCAGNRRADLQQVRATSGDQWAPGAIGNAEWTGVPLRSVLAAAGAETGSALHLCCEAVDIARNEDAPDAPFGISIPMPKALSEDVLLAWAMNGAPLTPEHGAPVRLVVPGFAGVRSAKWVARLRVQDRPSDAFQQAQDYHLYPPATRNETADPARGMAINEMPLNAAICVPASGAALPAGRVRLEGYAIATGRAVTRVDISANGGRDWSQAIIEENGNQPWSWVFWHAELDIAAGEHELAVRAWDSAGQTQPSQPDDVWNFKGYLSAAWHRVRVKVA